MTYPYPDPNPATHHCPRCGSQLWLHLAIDRTGFERGCTGRPDTATGLTLFLDHERTDYVDGPGPGPVIP